MISTEYICQTCGETFDDPDCILNSYCIACIDYETAQAAQELKDETQTLSCTCLEKQIHLDELKIQNARQMFDSLYLAMERK